MSKFCPNCKNEVSEEKSICPFCGTNLNGETNKTKQNLSVDSNSIKKGILSAVLGILGIIIMLAYRAWLGVPIYAVGAVIAILHLRNEYTTASGSLIDFIKDNLKSKDIGLILMTVVAVLLPVVVVVGSIFWIYVDTEREVEAMFGSIKFFK